MARHGAMHNLRCHHCLRNRKPHTNIVALGWVGTDKYYVKCKCLNCGSVSNRSSKCARMKMERKAKYA